MTALIAISHDCCQTLGMRDNDDDDNEDRNDEPGGVKAVETGMRLLAALSEDPHPQMLKNLAARASMHPAKAHRYLVSFLRAGLVQRDTETGFYRFGPLAIQVGVAALGSLNVVRVASEEVARLRDELGVTVALAVWGTHGATHVFVEEANKIVIVKSRLGGALPLVKSATGRMFSAYLPQFVTQPMIDEELKVVARSAAARAKLRTEFYQSLDEVRRNGMSRALGDLSPGIHALCCPIHDHRDSLAAGLTILAPAGEFDPAIDGAPATALREAALRISRLMGAARK